MEYARLCEAYDAIESTSKRLEKTAVLAALLKDAGEDLERIILLLQGRVFPAWDKRRIGMSTQIMLRALSRSSGSTAERLEREWSKVGDLGLVAEKHITGRTQQTLFSAPLTVEKVFEGIKRLARIEGAGSVDTKLKTVSELLSQSTPREARYVTRTVLEQLRIGIATSTLRDGIVRAFLEKEAGMENGTVADREQYNAVIALVQGAYDRTNDFTQVATAAQAGIAALQQVHIQIGVPVKVMLGVKGKGTEEAIAALGGEALFQFKYDGFRVQIHKDGDAVRIFTRRLEDVTEQFPDIVSRVRSHVECDSCILDGEAIGVDPQTGGYRPFQEVSQRIRRKHGIDGMAERLPVDVRLFDILLLDGEELLARDLRFRHETVARIVRPGKLIGAAHTLITGDVAEAQAFYDQALATGEEGLFAKKLDSTYQPGTRVGNWIKIKSTMEPLDLVVVAAEWGEGKRSGWFTSYVLACRDEEGNLLEMGRVATGLKELREEGFSFEEMTELIEPLIEGKHGKMVTVRPEIVLEVAYDEIQRSPSYAAGFALRFPRVLRNRSDERGVEDISSLSYVEQLYSEQR